MSHSSLTFPIPTWPASCSVLWLMHPQLGSCHTPCSCLLAFAVSAFQPFQFPLHRLTCPNLKAVWPCSPSVLCEESSLLTLLADSQPRALNLGSTSVAGRSFYLVKIIFLLMSSPLDSNSSQLLTLPLGSRTLTMGISPGHIGLVPQTQYQQVHISNNHSIINLSFPTSSSNHWNNIIPLSFFLFFSKSHFPSTWN